MHKFLLSLLTTRNLVPWHVDRRREENTKNKKTKKQKNKKIKNDERENRTVWWKYIYKTPHVRHDGLRIWNELTGCFRISNRLFFFLLVFLYADFSCLFLVSFPLFKKCARALKTSGCGGVSFIKPSNVPYTESPSKRCSRAIISAIIYNKLFEMELPRCACEFQVLLLLIPH